MANGTSLGSTSLAGGIAIFSGNNLPKGDVSVVAVYSGDSTYLGSSSNIVQISVN